MKYSIFLVLLLVLGYSVEAGCIKEIDDYVSYDDLDDDDYYGDLGDRDWFYYSFDENDKDCLNPQPPKLPVNRLYQLPNLPVTTKPTLSVRLTTRPSLAVGFMFNDPDRPLKVMTAPDTCYSEELPLCENFENFFLADNEFVILGQMQPKQKIKVVDILRGKPTGVKKGKKLAKLQFQCGNWDDFGDQSKDTFLIAIDSTGSTVLQKPIQVQNKKEIKKIAKNFKEEGKIEFPEGPGFLSLFMILTVKDNFLDCLLFGL